MPRLSRKRSVKRLSKSKSKRSNKKRVSKRRRMVGGSFLSPAPPARKTGAICTSSDQCKSGACLMGGRPSGGICQ